VLDSGDGIADDELPFIWERYYKSGKKHKRSVTGTGLGLSIVKKIIELHAGVCGVTSKKGEGSIFWFEINLAEES
jgi:signal transduction histidine kinase